MTRGSRPGRAGALLLTGLVLVATSQSKPPAFEFDVASSCGPAGRITFDDAFTGCSEDPSTDLLGAGEVGLPPWALGAEHADERPEVRFVMAGPVVLPGSEPATTVHRTCRVDPEADGVRPFTCEGEAPEAACEGTLTLVPRPAARVAP